MCSCITHIAYKTCNISLFSAKTMLTVISVFCVKGMCYHFNTLYTGFNEVGKKEQTKRKYS